MRLPQSFMSGHAMLPPRCASAPPPPHAGIARVQVRPSIAPQFCSCTLPARVWAGPAAGWHPCTVSRLPSPAMVAVETPLHLDLEACALMVPPDWRAAEPEPCSPVGGTCAEVGSRCRRLDGSWSMPGGPIGCQAPRGCLCAGTSKPVV